MPESVIWEADVNIKGLLIVIEFDVPSGARAMFLSHLPSIPIQIPEDAAQKTRVFNMYARCGPSIVVRVFGKVLAVRGDHISDVFVHEDHCNLKLDIGTFGLLRSPYPYDVDVPAVIHVEFLADETERF